MKGIDKILLIRYSAIGDIVLSIPAFRILRQSLPKAYIALIINPLGRQIVSKCPYIDELIIYDKTKRQKSLCGYVQFIQNLRKKQFDLVIDFQNNRRSAIITYLSGAKRTIGYGKKYRSFFYANSLNIIEDRDKPFNYFNRLLAVIDVPPVENRLELWTTEEDERKAVFFLTQQGVKDSDLLIGIHAGAGKRWFSKKWPRNSFAKLIDKLNLELQAKIVMIGGADDIKLTKKIIEATRSKPIDATGKTTLRQLAAILKRCNLFIGSDSGPMHIASAINIPSVILFGPTDPKKHAFAGRNNIIIKHSLACSPCYRHKCDRLDCMKNISVEEVFEAAKKQILNNV